jgi:fatty acid desaturase
MLESAAASAVSLPAPVCTHERPESWGIGPCRRCRAVQERDSEYAQLKRLVTREGLLARRPLAAALLIVRSLLLLAAALLLLVLLPNLWLRLIDAAVLGVAFTQIGFIGHDTGHGQIARRGWRRELISLVHGNLLLGVSAGWWVDKHNRHHSHPNQADLDPDIDIPIIAFSPEQALKMRGPIRLIGKYQAYFLFPLFTLEGLSLRLSSVRFLLRTGAKRRWLELGLLAAHALCYGGLLVVLLGVWPALLFIAVHQALFGVYMSAVFAPNHKGMLVLENDSELDFLRRQVLTARNVRSRPLIDFWYGGLNYQIEHHLFPSMPRANLKRAQGIIKQFCAEHGISYHETGVVQSYREILCYLHEVSAPLRA